MSVPLMHEDYPYPASKAAVTHLTKVLAYRLIKDGIHVNGIAPGAFPSDMNKIARDNPEMVANLTPYKRVGNAEDMVGTALYLASTASDFMIGHTMVIDGGFATIGMLMPSL